MQELFTTSIPLDAPGRLPGGEPIAVIDIGSNSIRLVIYEGLKRSLTPIFNEKALCGLGREVATTGRLAEEPVAQALRALKRFRALCDAMRLERVHVLATAAARDAANGAEFLAEAQSICREPIELLSGEREAQLSAYGVAYGMHHADGLVGDMGGGSLELVEVHEHEVGSGITLPLGGLTLQDLSGDNLRKAEKLVRDGLADVPHLAQATGKTFYAVGGTWRALARMHMAQMGYPLRVMHGYTMSAAEAVAFAQLVRRVTPEVLASNKNITSARLPLLSYGALVLEHIIRRAKPAQVTISASGVREGLLYSFLNEEERKRDPLLSAAGELNYLRARSPRHGGELVIWTDQLFASMQVDETEEERRLRHAACHLADIGWRAHSDYRGEQSVNVIANAALLGIDHPGRAFLALSIYYRYEGLSDEGVSPRLRELASTRILDLARLLGASFRVAYLVSASMPGILPRAPLKVEEGKLVLTLPEDLKDLAGDRLFNRVKQLARLIGCEPTMC